jgi:small GTP-binding protein
MELTEQSAFPRIKVVFLGEVDTGKTNIISQLTTGTFYEKYATTMLASEQTKIYDLNGKTFIIDYWDTAGQEKYRTINKFYYQSAQVVALVYSITNKKSFEAIKKYWIGEVREHLGDKCGM